MKKLSTYLLIFFMIMFWGFRVILAVGATVGADMGFPVENLGIEVALLFITILSAVLIIKRKILGSLLYLLTYVAYFGPSLWNGIMQMMEESASLYTYTGVFASFLGVILPLAILLDLLFDKNRMAHPVDKKTDWFYKEEKFDRQMDERADKNNYRTL